MDRTEFFNEYERNVQEVPLNHQPPILDELCEKLIKEGYGSNLFDKINDEMNTIEEAIGNVRDLIEAV